MYCNNISRILFIFGDGGINSIEYIWLTSSILESTENAITIFRADVNYRNKYEIAIDFTGKENYQNLTITIQV